VEKRAGIPSAVSAEARYFRSQPVVSHSRDGAANNSNPHDLVPQNSPEREKMADYRLVVPMVQRHKRIRLTQLNANVVKFGQADLPSQCFPSTPQAPFSLRWNAVAP